MARKYKSFFSNKQCQYCKQPATIFRLIKNHHEVMCDESDCNKKSLIKAGFFGIVPLSKK